MGRCKPSASRHIAKGRRRRNGTVKFSPIKHVRAFTVRGGGADYHDQGGGHWIDDHIATPMARYPQYRQSRQSFGINVLGTLVVEIEAENGVTGFAVTTGGEPACYIVEKHLARFLEGRDPAEVEKIWGQMYFSTQYSGRTRRVLWAEGPGHQCRLRRRSGAVGPPRQVARRTGASAAGRRGA